MVNLQNDIDHPTQSMVDILHLAHHFGGLDKLKGNKIAMTWAYSPSYGKPLSKKQAKASGGSFLRKMYGWNKVSAANTCPDIIRSISNSS